MCVCVCVLSLLVLFRHSIYFCSLPPAGGDGWWVMGGGCWCACVLVVCCHNDDNNNGQVVPERKEYKNSKYAQVGRSVGRSVGSNERTTYMCAQPFTTLFLCLRRRRCRVCTHHQARFVRGRRFLRYSFVCRLTHATIAASASERIVKFQRSTGASTTTRVWCARPTLQY